MTTRQLTGAGIKNVQDNPKSDFYHVVEVLNDMAALDNELRTDHATTKTAVDETKTLIDELHDDAATNRTAIASLVSKLNYLVTNLLKDKVVSSENAGAGPGLAIHGTNTENALSANDIAIQHGGAVVRVAADAEIDISALTAGGDTITQDDHGCLFVFGLTDGTIDVESTKAAEDYTSLIDAIASYGHEAAISTYLGANEAVCIGAIHVEENNSGAFTWGTDALGGETANNYYDVVGDGPQVINDIASLALDAGTSTFTYGAGTVILGTGARVALTGKANVVSEVGSAIADGNVGAWVIYALADDVEIAKQLGNAYADEATAVAAVRDMIPNPILPIIGYFTVDNGSGGSWTMGTENFDDTGVTSTFYIAGNGTNAREIGRAAMNQEIAATTDDPAGTLTASKPTAGPATLTAAAVDDFTFRTLGTP
jgi:hypothetical protein